MAVVTQTNQDNVTELYLGFFGRAPDAAGFGYWVNALANGVSVQTVANAMATSPEFVSNYGGLTPAQQVTKIYMNVLNRVPDAGGLTYWTNALNSGTSLSTVVWSIVNSAFTQVGTADGLLVQNKATVGEYFAITLASNDTAQAATAYNLVTSNPASVAQAEASLSSVTYTLTTAIETINVNKVDATIVGYATTGTAAGDTFQAGDTLNGLANGNTTIQLTAAGTIAANPAITNVANLNVRAAATSVMAANAGYSIITSTNSSASMDFTGIAKSATLGFGGFGAATGGAFDVRYTYAAGALGSATATQALVLNGVGTTTSRPIVGIFTAGTDVITTLNVAASGFNAITAINTAGNTNAFVALKTLNVTGSGSFRVIGGSNVLGQVTTINAGTNTGGVNIDLATGGNTQNVTFTGGTGNDRIAFAAGAFDINDSLNMGTGTNTLALGDQTISTAATPNLVTAIKAVTGLTVLDATYTSGTGTGTLTFNANNIGLSNYTVSGASTGATGAASTAAGNVGSSAVVIAGQLNTQAFLFTASETGGAGSGGATGGNNAGGNGAAAVSVAANLDNGSNALTLVIGNATTGAGVTFTGGAGGDGQGTANGGAGGVGFDATNFETVNLTVTGAASTFIGGAGGAGGTGSGAAAGAAGAGLVVSTNATVNVIGSQDLTLGPVAGTNVTITVDSAYANALSVATLSGNTTVTSGSGNDTIVLAAGGQTATVNAGAGNDVINLVGASTYVNANNAVTTTAGVNNVQAGGANHGDVITLGGGTDTVRFTANNLANLDAISAGTTRIVSLKDFVVGADKIAMINGAANAISFTTAQTVASADTLTQVYAGITAIATSGTTLSAALVTVNSGARAGTYLYVNDGTAAVSNTADMLVNITGISGTLSAADFVFA